MESNDRNDILMHLLREARSISSGLLPSSTDAAAWWLDEASLLLNRFDDFAAEAMASFWGDRGNVHLLLKASAWSISNTLHATPLARRLNTFVNTPPHVRICNGYLTNFDFYTPTMDFVKRTLARFQHERSIRGLILYPEHGVMLGVLLDSILTDSTCRIDYLKPPYLLASERNFLDANLARCRGGRRACMVSGSELTNEVAHPNPRDIYSFIYLQGVRTLKRRPNPLQTLETLLFGWDRLSIGGLLVVEDMHLRSDAINAFVWQAGHESALIALARAQRGSYVIEQDSDVVVLRKTRL